jgi:hypothetical protein
MTRRAVREGFFDLAVGEPAGSMAIDVGRHADPALALQALRSKAADMHAQAARLAQAGQQHPAASVTAQDVIVGRNADALEARTRVTTAIEQARLAADHCDVALLALGNMLSLHKDAPGALRSVCGSLLDESEAVLPEAITGYLQRSISVIEELALELLELDPLAAAEVARMADALSRRADALMQVIEGHVRVAEIGGEPEQGRLLMLALMHVLLAADEHRAEQAAAVVEHAAEAARVRAELEAGLAYSGESTSRTRARRAAAKDSGTRGRGPWRATPVNP